MRPFGAGLLTPPFHDRQVSPATLWVDEVRHFGRWYHRLVGRAATLCEASARRGRRWVQGIAHSREAFA